MLNISLKETFRVMKRGGILCASFRADNLQNLINDKFFNTPLGKQKNKIQNYDKKNFHKINLTKEEIRKFIELSGF